MKKRYKVVSIPRFVTFIVLSTVLALTAIYSAGGIFWANAGTDRSSYKTVYHDADAYTEIIVSPGDTLWSIARDYYGSSVDKRLAVYEIRNANHMKDTSLRAGQMIRLPEKI